MDLLAAYTQKTSTWLSIAPKSAKENRLLVLQGSSTELAHYRKLGWNAEALLFAIGLTSTFEKSEGFTLVSPWANSWPLDGVKFDAILCNGNANAVFSMMDLSRHILALLHPQGLWYAQIMNPDYYGEILARQGREVWPQPGDPPRASYLSLQDLENSLDQWGAQLVDAREIVDNMYHNPEMPRWPSINGWDCTLYLPSDPALRKLHFISSWQITLRMLPVSEASETLAPEELASLHQEIESLLEGARLEEAGLILDKLFQSGRAEADTCNLQGVLHFYREQFPQAWESFRMAILLDGDRLDFYQNMADVASKAERSQETAVILKRAQGRVPGVEEIRLDG